MRPASADRQHGTVIDLRNVGTAMTTWFIDHADTGHAGLREQQGPIRWSECPAISQAELEDILVPQYITVV
jgi:hypothetical protein